MNGTLYLVATPIGNLEDMSFRAIKTLQEVDIIAAEDTRHSIKLLNHFDIKKNLESYHEHNKVEKGQKLVQELLSGKNIALITDAGTPAISDPGEDLVKLCQQNGISVTSIPGPVALITGLILSGKNTRRFCFEGFLPFGKKERRELLDQLKNETRTIILYEAPHKLKDTLQDLISALGERNITLTRELTKKFEEIVPTTLSEAITYYKENDPRGEYVLILEGASAEAQRQEKIDQWLEMTLEEHLAYYIEKGLSKMEGIKAVAKDRNIPKREIYNHFTNEE